MNRSLPTQTLEILVLITTSEKHKQINIRVGDITGMSNPFKDAQIQKRREQRRKNAEKYNCTIIWYDTHPAVKDISDFPEHKQDFPQIANKVKPYFLDLADERFPFVTVLKENEPEVEGLITGDGTDGERWETLAASQNEGEVNWFPVWYSLDDQYLREEEMGSLRDDVEERMQRLVDELELVRGFPKYDSYKIIDGVKTEFDS